MFKFGLCDIARDKRTGFLGIVIARFNLKQRQYNLLGAPTPTEQSGVKRRIAEQRLVLVTRHQPTERLFYETKH